MTESLIEALTIKSPYIGKLGLDNLLMMLAGVLYFVLYAL